MNRDSYSLALKIRTTVVLAIAVSALLIPTGLTLAQDYLDTDEVAGVGAGSLSAAWLGHTAREIDTSNTSIIKGPSPLLINKRHEAD